MHVKDYKQKNTIAYDTYLRERLETLHHLLGTNITDVASGAMEYAYKFNPEAKEVLKTMSRLTSDLSVDLMNAKSDKKILTKEEQEDFDHIKEVVEYLGNMQFKLNKIIQKSKELQNISVELNDLGISFTNDILDAQEKFRSIRADINDFGIMSEDQKTASSFEKQLKDENK